MGPEIQIEDMREGAGAEARAGSTVTVHYVGTLTNGKKFDSSRDRGKGFTFKLGAGQVIKGWDQGVAGMKIGQMRKLTIPPELAYGSAGFPPVIPPGSTLVFEIELLAVS
jgi:FKBP-type peptidyl-prolyl cis-trans isomerase